MSLDFVAVDVETANSQRGSICSFGVADVVAGQVVRTESWLSRPPASLDWFDGINTSIHGIRQADLAGQPSFAERLAQVIELVADRPVVAHNAAFDIGAISQGCRAEGLAWPEFTFGCTMVLSRRLLNLPSYRLPIVCAELGIPLTRHHDSGADAQAAAQVALSLARRQRAGSLEELATGANVRFGQMTPDEWRACASAASSGGPSCAETPAANRDADPSHPFYGQVIVFTGALSLRREDAWAAVAALGATPEKSVTKRTTMLVIGDGFTADSLDDFHSGKAEKAVRWRQKGHRVEILTEGDFLSILP